MEGKKRIPELDVLRGLGIYLSVLGHCITYGNGAEYKASLAWQCSVVYRLIYSFHMPLLTMVSALALFCSIQSNSQKPMLTIYRKASRLVIPMFSWGVFSSAFYYVFAPERFPRSLGQFFWTCADAYWYLTAILICTTLTLLIHYLLKDNLLAFMAVIILFFILPDTHSLAAQKTMFIYFYTVFVLADKILSFLDDKHNNSRAQIFILLSISVVLFVAIFPWFSGDKTFHVFSIHNIDNVLGRIVRVILRVALGFSGAYIASALFLSAFKEVSAIRKILSIIGKESFGIYVLSSWILEWGVQKITRNCKPSAIMTLAESLLITLLCYLITIIAKKIPVINYCFFGGKVPKLNIEGIFVRKD